MLIMCVLCYCQLPDIEVKKPASQFMLESQKINSDEITSAVEKSAILPRQPQTYVRYSHGLDILQPLQITPHNKNIGKCWD